MKARAREQRVIQNSAKRFRADFAFADVLVAIHARAEHRLRIVDVQHEDAVEPYRAVDQPQGRFEAFGGANIVARGEHVRGINANADIQIAAAFEDRFHLFELPAERAFPARRCFRAEFSDRRASNRAAPAADFE